MTEYVGVLLYIAIATGVTSPPVPKKSKTKKPKSKKNSG
jgi:hypothetical protein